MYDVAVVGKGLFGAATARHLARAGLRTAVVGPDEPAQGDRSFAGPFGAHFDEGRIIVARGEKPSVALTELALDGMLSLGVDLDRPLVTPSGALEVTSAGSGPMELVDGALAVARDADRFEAPPPQGYFNPRRYIAAALDDMLVHGGELISDVVESVERAPSGFLLSTRGGTEIRSRRLVHAAGAWSNGLMERQLALRLKREHVLFAELEPAVADSIQMRPTVIHGVTGRVEDIYTLPPLLYPDGRWYLKLGANTFHDQPVPQVTIDDWYRDGDSDQARDDLLAAFRAVFPSVAVRDFHTERCVITYTSHGRPYIDQVAEGLFVAAGGNGHGASWADGVGTLVARLVTGEDWDGLNRDDFRATFVDERFEWSEPLLLSQRESA